MCFYSKKKKKKEENTKISKEKHYPIPFQVRRKKNGWKYFDPLLRDRMLVGQSTAKISQTECFDTCNKYCSYNLNGNNRGVLIF